MAAAAIPLIELGLQEAPQLISLGMKIINDLKLAFHKPADQKFSPADVATVQAMSLSGFRAKLLAEFPEMSKTLTDSQLQMFMEMLYQVQKKVTADIAPPVIAVVPASNDAYALMIGKVLLGLIGPLLAQFAIPQQVPAQ